MDDVPAYLATPAKTSVENHFKRFYTPESVKVSKKGSCSTFGRAKRKLHLQGDDAPAGVRTAQAIFNGKKTQFLTSCHEHASTNLEQTRIAEAEAPGTRLTDIAKEAKSIVNGLSQANNPGCYRSGGQFKGRCHWEGKPFQDIANRDMPDDAGCPTYGPVNAGLAVSNERQGQKSTHGHPHADLPPGASNPPKRRAVRDGGHENFVRSTMKKGKSSFKFKSKSGSSSRNPKNKRWAMHKLAAESLSVAGLGADNANEASLVCFRCGQKGHWARDCKADMSAQAVVDLSWCTNNVALLGSSAPPLPRVLRADILSAMSSRHMEGSIVSCQPNEVPEKDESIKTCSETALVTQQKVTAEADTGSEPTSVCLQQMTQHHEGSVPGSLSHEHRSQIRPARSAEGPLRELMQECFGYTDFKLFQLPVIQQVMMGESCMVVQPTGAGKSLCFQLPAMLLPGLVLVVSPLTAHVRDAVAKLPACVPAGVCLGGAFKRASMATLQAAVEGRLKLLYVTPECLAMSWVADKLQGVHISLACVDEAHHASERSPTCRPGCLQLPQRLARCAPTAIRLLLTATAAADAREGLCDDFRISPQRVWCAAPVRHELQLCVAKCDGAAGDCRAQADVLRAVSPGGALGGCACVLVYCCFRSHAEQLAAYLHGRGVSAMAYHAGLSAAARQDVSDSLRSGRVSVVTCTTALSTGLDCSRVDGVLHYSLPPSMEEYVQQIGRSGRGGGSASALVLLRDADMRVMHSLKHSCDCDALAVKRILQALLDAARAAMAHDAGVNQKKGRGKRVRAVGASDKGNATETAAKRKRPAKVAKKHDAGRPAVAQEGVAKCIGAVPKPVRQAKQRKGKCDAWEEEDEESVHSGDSEAGDEDIDSGDDESGGHHVVHVEPLGVRRSARLAGPPVQPPQDATHSSSECEGDHTYAGSGAGSAHGVSSTAASPNDTAGAVPAAVAADHGALAANEAGSEQVAATNCARPDAAGAAGSVADAGLFRARGAGEECDLRSLATRPGQGSDEVAEAVGAPVVQPTDHPGADDATESGRTGSGEPPGEGGQNGREQCCTSGDDAPAAQRVLHAVPDHATAVRQVQHADADGGEQLGGTGAGTATTGVAGEVDTGGKGAEAATLRVAAAGAAAAATVGGADQVPSDGQVVVLQTKQLAVAAQVTTDAVELVLAVLGRAAPRAALPLGSTMANVKVACYKRQPEEVAADEPVFAALMAAGRRRNGTFSASMQAVARAAGVAPDAVQDTLQRLAGRGEVHFEASGDSSVAVRVREDDPAWHGGTAGIARRVFERLEGIQRATVGKLEGMYQVLNSVCGRPAAEQAQALQQHIGREFAVGEPPHTSGACANGPAGDCATDTQAAGDAPGASLACVSAAGLPFDMELGKMTSLRVAAIVEEARQRAGSGVQLTGRAIASMLHGRDMPAFPRAAWSKCPGWGSCMHVRFGDLRRHAQAKLLEQV